MGGISFDSNAPGPVYFRPYFLRVNSNSTITGAIQVTGGLPTYIEIAPAARVELSGGITSTAPLGFRPSPVLGFGSPSALVSGPSSLPHVGIEGVAVDLGPSFGAGAIGEVWVQSQGHAGVLNFSVAGQHAPGRRIFARALSTADLWGTDQTASDVTVNDSWLYLGVIGETTDLSRLTTTTLDLTRAVASFVLSGSASDQIRASSVVLNGVLQFVIDGPVTPGATFRIIDNIGGSPVQGTFLNIGEGFVYQAGRQLFRLSYVGGTGNDVTLTQFGGLQSTWGFGELVEHGGTMLGAPALSTWGPGRLDAWAVGADRALWHRWAQGGAAGWEPLGGTLLSTPAAVSDVAGQADVFARGLDNALWTRRYRGGWSPWIRLGGILSDAPSATSPAPGQIDIAARGVDGTLWHARMVNGVFQGWAPLSGASPSAPTITDWGAGHLEVFARGLDGALWQKTFANGAWGPWRTHGGILTDAPAVASSEPGELALFARGVDGVLWHRSYEGARWSEWVNYGLPLIERPAAVGVEPGHLELGVRSPSLSLWTSHGTQSWAETADAGASAAADQGTEVGPVADRLGGGLRAIPVGAGSAG